MILSTVAINAQKRVSHLADVLRKKEECSPNLLHVLLPIRDGRMAQLVERKQSNERELDC